MKTFNDNLNLKMPTGCLKAHATQPWGYAFWMLDSRVAKISGVEFNPGEVSR